MNNNLIMMIAGLAGGFALLIFAMSYINDSLQKAAGQQFRTILATLTASRIKGAATGFFLTSLNQSSTATTFLAVGLVSGGMLTLLQFMTVSLGASVGSTITAQLIAFRLTDFALLIIAFGYLLSYGTKGKKISVVGDVIFGFGTLFFAMSLMMNAVAPIAKDHAFLSFMTRTETPALGIVAGVLITLIMQSSGAVVGMVIALAIAGALTLQQSVYLALGSQLGTVVTIVLASFKLPRQAKRAVLWQITQHLIAIILIYPFLKIVSVSGEGVWFIFVKKFTRMFFFTEDIGRQIAMSHSLVAVFNALLLLPLVKYLQRFMFFVYPFKNSEVAFGTVYIDVKKVEEDPHKALELSKSEILRMGGFVSEMLTSSIKAFKTRDLDIPRSISSKGFKIDMLAKEITPYIVNIGKHTLEEKQAKDEVQLLYILADLGDIASIIDRNLMFTARKKISSFSRFSDEGLDDIKAIHLSAVSNLESALTAFETNDKNAAAEIAASSHKYREKESEMRLKHIARLRQNLKESIETSGFHMDILEQYTRINAIICSMAGSVVDMS